MFLERVPVFKNFAVSQQILETAVGPAFMEVAHHRVEILRQVLLNKRERKFSATFQIGLVR